MDLKQIEYILEIAKENNITRAAGKLFITQSALNQQLLKLEKELGTPLFHRSRTNWRLTNAGEVYIENAKEILRIKQKTYNTIHDMIETKKGRFSVGFTPGRSTPMFTQIYPHFHRQFPQIVVMPIESTVKKQQEMIRDGDLDIGFLTVEDGKIAYLEYVQLSREDIVLAVPQNHPFSKGKKGGSTLSMKNFKKLKDEPFVLSNNESSMHPIIEGIFQRAEFTPKVLFETANNTTAAAMVKSGVCCGILPRYYIEDSSEITSFLLEGLPSWNIVAAYRKDNYLGQTAQEFISLSKQYWKDTLPSLQKGK